MKYTNDHILEFLEEWAPQSTKLEYDNVGLLIGDKHQEVNRILVTLDVTAEVVDEAIAAGAGLIVAHHPLIFRKLSRITPSGPTGSLIYKLIKNDISVIAAHSNLDAAYGGVSFVMAEKLGLKNTRFLKENQGSEDAGTRKTESGFTDTQSAAGFGAIGELHAGMDMQGFLSLVRDKLDSQGIRYGNTAESIKKVAVCGGSGAFLIEDARLSEADAYVTADLKYHDFFSESSSMLVVDAGHYESEVPIVGILGRRLQKRFAGIDILSTEVNTNPVKYFR